MFNFGRIFLGNLGENVKLTHWGYAPGAAGGFATVQTLGYPPEGGPRNVGKARIPIHAKGDFSRSVRLNAVRDFLAIDGIFRGIGNMFYPQDVPLKYGVFGQRIDKDAPAFCYNKNIFCTSDGYWRAYGRTSVDGRNVRGTSVATSMNSGITFLGRNRITPYNFAIINRCMDPAVNRVVFEANGKPDPNVWFNLRDIRGMESRNYNMGEGMVTDSWGCFPGF